MSIFSICQSIQNTGFSTAVRESTWGFPILSAVHVLALAWFGGALAISDLRRLGWAAGSESLAAVAVQLRAWNRLGLAVLLATGALLFYIEPLKCYQSVSFRIKLALLILIGLNTGLPGKVAAGASLLLWIAVIFAARGIAFF
jgi:uncharacterized membrane protein